MMFKPLLPYLSDFVAHVCWYSQHLATVHYEHGKYHVHYEVNKAEKNNSQENSTAAGKEVFANEHLIVLCQYHHPSYKFIKSIFALQPSHVLDGYLKDNDIPPRI